MTSLINGLRKARLARGWTQEATARRAGISRQSYAAIESASSVPSTEVALRLAAAFGRPVESLFCLPNTPAEQVTARWVGEVPPRPGSRVRLFQVAGSVLADAVGCGDRPNRMADGTILGSRVSESAETGGSGLMSGGSRPTLNVELFADRPSGPDLVVVGCDPAIGVVMEALSERHGIDLLWRQRGSRAALGALGAGEAHIAGAHLKDSTGEFNGRWVEELVPFSCTRVSFAWWEQGILVAPGNPLGISDLADLARPDLRFLNREPGSGSRALLDDFLTRAGIPADHLPGYSTVARGHMSVAESVASGAADAGIAIRAAGNAYGLEVVPLGSERYDLIIPDHFLDLPAVQTLLDALANAGVRAQVEALGGYDVSVMGRPCPS